MDKTIFKDFTEADKESIMNMVEDFYTSPAVSQKIPPENFSAAYSEMCNGGSERLRGIAIMQNDSYAGFASLSFSYSTEAGGAVVLVEEIYIKPDYRSCGLGGKTIEYILNEYRDKAARIRLEVEPGNSGAMKLYKRYGFKHLNYKQMINEDF